MNVHIHGVNYGFFEITRNEYIHPGVCIPPYISLRKKLASSLAMKY